MFYARFGVTEETLEYWVASGLSDTMPDRPKRLYPDPRIYWKCPTGSLPRGRSD